MLRGYDLRKGVTRPETTLENFLHWPTSVLCTASFILNSEPQGSTEVNLPETTQETKKPKLNSLLKPMPDVMEAIEKGYIRFDIICQRGSGVTHKRLNLAREVEKFQNSFRGLKPLPDTYLAKSKKKPDSSEPADETKKS